jgi:hypothetical protein
LGVAAFSASVKTGTLNFGAADGVNFAGFGADVGVGVGPVTVRAPMRVPMPIPVPVREAEEEVGSSPIKGMRSRLAAKNFSLAASALCFAASASCFAASTPCFACAAKRIAATLCSCSFRAAAMLSGVGRGSDSFSAGVEVGLEAGTETGAEVEVDVCAVAVCADSERCRPRSLSAMRCMSR